MESNEAALMFLGQKAKKVSGTISDGEMGVG
jgi:hypothetical protein